MVCLHGAQARLFTIQMIPNIYWVIWNTLHGALSHWVHCKHKGVNKGVYLIHIFHEVNMFKLYFLGQIFLILTIYQHVKELTSL